MVRFVITPDQAASVGNYMNSVRGRILQAIAEQMGVEMETLADTVAGRLEGNPITQHSGRLLAAVMRSPKVVETQGAIRGSVSAQDGALNLGLWLEKGHRFPNRRLKLLEKSNKNNILKRLSTDQLQELRTQGGSVKPYPFLIPSLLERESPIMENIRQKVADAIAS